jgi:hypothetical protein
MFSGGRPLVGALTPDMVVTGGPGDGWPMKLFYEFVMDTPVPWLPKLSLKSEIPPGSV